MSCHRMLTRNRQCNYAEQEEPGIDEFEFCDKCGDFAYDHCSIHGPMRVVPDDKAYRSRVSDVPRAMLTVPSEYLRVAPSNIPGAYYLGAGLGVFTRKTLKPGIRFGPYKGRKTVNINSQYCWKIHDRDGKYSHAIDAVDANRSNWMRYVNCSRHVSEENVQAYQYKGKLYYKTIKKIPRHTELLIWYGASYAKLLGIDLQRYEILSRLKSKEQVPRDQVE